MRVVVDVTVVVLVAVVVDIVVMLLVADVVLVVLVCAFVWANDLCRLRRQFLTPPFFGVLACFWTTKLTTRTNASELNR